MRTITQSELKDFLAYKKKEMCGTEFAKRWVTRDMEWKSSKPQRLGSYFEFIVTDTLGPHDDGDPAPDLLKTGKMGVDFQRAHDRALMLKSIMADSGMTILSAQERFEKDMLRGIYDMKVDYNGEIAIVDLKYSGLLNDRWSAWGWSGLDYPEQKNHHKIQAIHYSAISGLPYYYLVVSSQPKFELKLIKWEVTEEDIQEHKETAQEAIDQIETLKVMDSWLDYPEIIKCLDCPLAAECSSRTTRLNPLKIKS